MTEYRKKLIEVALPLDAINAASAREKSIRHGHPSTLHLWWARRPLAACRAVLFSQLVDDPSAWPNRFPTEDAQDKERQRIFGIIEELVKWESTTNETVLNAARREIARSLARGRVADGEGNKRDQEVLADGASMKAIRKYLAEVAPPVHDPFAGGGSIPLEAQRLGLRAIASDLNPVAVMINKALIEIPPKFAGRPPVGPVPKGDKQTKMTKTWKGAQGLAEDVRRYGEWVREEAYKRIGHLYPEVEVTAEMAKDRPDLRSLVGQKLTVIAWLWARTVESPNPAFKGEHVPLVSNFFLSTKKGKEAWVEPVLEGQSYRFRVRTGVPNDITSIKTGTKLGRGANFQCVLSKSPIDPEYIKTEGKAGRIGSRMMAIAAEGKRRRVYLPPTDEMAGIASSAIPSWSPEGTVPERLSGGTCFGYGLETFSELFTPRQLLSLNTFSDLVVAARDQVIDDALVAGLDAGVDLDSGGFGATAYADAIAVFLAFGVSRMADISNALCTWSSLPSKEHIAHLFGRQAIPMVWDYGEANPFTAGGGGWSKTFRFVPKAVSMLPPYGNGKATQENANRAVGAGSIISTDPPYYDNICYADLSDFFYVWLRHTLRQYFPNIFRTLLVPKDEELIAAPHRHGGKEGAESFFEDGMERTLAEFSRQGHDKIPMSIYYAFKQSESSDEGTSSTGWETFLQAVVGSGFSIIGTWPIRTERNFGLKTGVNALASSVVLVCRKRESQAPRITRGDFRNLLKARLPGSLRALQKGNIAPVDMAQAAIGPGMAIFSRHARVLEHDGSGMSIRTALQLINEIVDEIRGEEEADLDRESRFAITWFATYGFGAGPFGEAETLAKARNVSVSGVEHSGVLKAAAGKVRLLRREEMPEGWSPLTDKTLTIWECTQHLIKRLEQDGEQAAAVLLAKMGPRGEQTRILAYRLYTICERKKWAEEARAYNGLVIAWPELERLAAENNSTTAGAQGGLFEEE